MTPTKTIYALSSGKGRAGIAVIRISGTAAGHAIDLMAAPRPKTRFAAFRRIVHPVSRRLLDEALVLWIPGPRSETGEDMAELHVHGGAAVVRAVLSALGDIDGFRMAEGGEFARRAFENGKIDLTAAEGLADLVEAETEGQRRLALQQAGGALRRLYDGWRETALAALGLVEASIDFSDEGDVSEAAMADGRRAASLLAAEVGAHLADDGRGEVIRDGYAVVLAGPPNVGKSSLLNALARRDAAIVSPEAGTTRDVVEVRLDIGGQLVIVADTAGLRQSAGAIEREGMRRTLDRARAADLVLWIVDASAPVPTVPPDIAGDAAQVLMVVNKIDLVTQAPKIADDAIAVSAVTGLGIDTLTARIAQAVASRTGGDDVPLITQVRHRRALEGAHAALLRAVTLPSEQAELRAEDLRVAVHALGQVVGRIDVEEILGEIFGRFCIGK